MDATDCRRDHTNVDERLAGKRRGRVEDDPQRVRGLLDIGPRPVEARLELRRATALEGQHAVDEDAGDGSVDAVGTRVNEVEGDEPLEGHADLARPGIAIDEDRTGPSELGCDGVDVESG